MVRDIIELYFRSLYERNTCLILFCKFGRHMHERHTFYLLLKRHVMRREHTQLFICHYMTYIYLSKYICRPFEHIFMLNTIFSQNTELSFTSLCFIFNAFHLFSLLIYLPMKKKSAHCHHLLDTFTLLLYLHLFSLFIFFLSLHA